MSVLLVLLGLGAVLWVKNPVRRAKWTLIREIRKSLRGRP
jgi:hypothetical protein